MSSGQHRALGNCL